MLIQYYYYFFISNFNKYKIFVSNFKVKKTFLYFLYKSKIMKGKNDKDYNII